MSTGWDSHLPEDVVLNISLRVHKLNMASVLKGIKDPFRILSSNDIEPGTWNAHMRDNIHWALILANGMTIQTQNRYVNFKKEIKRVYYVDSRCCIGEMKIGAWFIYMHGQLRGTQNVLEDFVFLTKSKQVLLQNIPSTAE